MENSNRPVQRVIPLRSEYQNHVNSSFNCPASTRSIDSSCGESGQLFKILNSTNDLGGSHLSSNIESVPFLQQNVNIMNINLANNALIQGVSQDPSNNFPQSSNSPKTYLQLSDGRYVQIAQSIQPAQMPTTILLQMPYNSLNQSGLNANQTLMNKRFLLPTKVNEMSPQNSRYVTVGNPGNNFNNSLLSNQQMELYSKVDTQFKTVEQQPQYDSNHFEQRFGQNVSTNGNIIPIDKYQEICDMLQARKLLAKAACTEETVLVEFRLNQQKYQLRMTRNQKVDMEKLLISAGNQERQMEILQVYQSEQRKNMQQRTSVVLNQMINKNATNLVCNSPQMQSLNITKPIYPLNSVLVAVPQSQYSDTSLTQPSNSVTQSKNMPFQSTVSLQNSNGVLVNNRMPPAQSSLLSASSIPREPTKDILKQKRATKVSAIIPQTMPNLGSNQDMKPARSRRYNNMRKVLLDDQNSVTTPDCSHSFEDLGDVARRLLPYHILEESKDQKLDEVDRIISDTFTELNRRCTNLKRIASSITMKDIIADQSEEQLLIKRMQLDLEMDLFERERASVVAPLQISNHDNTVIVIEDSPPPEVQCEEDPLNDEDPPGTVDVAAMENLTEVVDTEDASDNLLDALCNYNIEDISNDGLDNTALGLDWDDEEEDKGSPVEDPQEGHQQSEDPDLDAAIKSILF